MKIDREMLESIKKLGLPQRTENNDSLVYSCYGDGERADPKFNVMVYNGKKGLTLNTNDKHTLKCLLEGKSTRPKVVKRVISIDDSGVGYLLGGVLCGVHDSKTDRIYTKLVDVKYFQGKSKTSKYYLEVYAQKAVEIVDSIQPDKETTLIKICTGYINVKAKRALRNLGYFVEVVEIKGKLQDELENLHRKYIQNEYGYPYYRDPKDMTRKQLAIAFCRLKKWVLGNNLKGQCKDIAGF